MTWPAQDRPCWDMAVSLSGVLMSFDKCPRVTTAQSFGTSPTIFISSDLITFYYSFLFLPRFLEYSLPVTSSGLAVKEAAQS